MTKTGTRPVLLINLFLLQAVTGAGGDVPPFYLAAKQGRLAELRELIATGADVNAVNPRGRSALMTAAWYRNERVVRELVVEGADINVADAQGRTALMLAVAAENLKFAGLLIAAGADISLKDKQDNTVQGLAEKSKNKALQKLLSGR